MIIYDIEVFKYDWIVCTMDMINKTRHTFHNDKDGFMEYHTEHRKDIWIGYNTNHYDKWIVFGILQGLNNNRLYELSKDLITSDTSNYKLAEEYGVGQFTLYNYDCMIDKLKSLKQLEGFMGDSIEECSIPWDIDGPLTPDELNEVIAYCNHDVYETAKVFMGYDKLQGEFGSHMSLIKEFELPLSNVSKTKTQISASILGAKKAWQPDPRTIIIHDNLRIKDYANVIDWFKTASDDQLLDIDIYGCPHRFAWGGLHGAILNYVEKGNFLNMDVSSFYPAIMIEYDLLSSNVPDAAKYREMRDIRMEFKRNKDKRQYPYKIVLNSTFGGMGFMFSNFYDPNRLRNTCVTGQLFLLDLIEKVAPYCEIIQSNTDGILVKYETAADYNRILDALEEWEDRTRFDLDLEEFTQIIQKDVNNYIMVSEDGSYKSKGAYVKKLNQLDYNMAIVNKAIIEYFINDTDPADTINQCDDLIEFQHVVKASSKYDGCMHGNSKLNGKVQRVFASTRLRDGSIYRLRNGKANNVSYTPEHCFIDNGDVKDKKIPDHLDKQWYINMVHDRISDFYGMEDYRQIRLY